MKKMLATILALIISINLATIHKSYTVETTDKKEQPVAIAATQEKAIATIKGLIAKNSAFAVKISHHELPLKVKIWQRKGLVKLPTNVPWETFKQDVHQFGVDLHALLERDEKGAYYHIGALTKDAALYKALSQMNQGFPKAPTGNGKESLLKIGKQPKLGLLTIINLYATQFYQQKLLERIKIFFKGFEEHAQELRTAEKKAQKTAEEPVPTTSFDEFDYSYTGTDFVDTPMDFDTTVEEYDFSTEPGEEDIVTEETELPEPDFDIESIDWGF